MIRKTKSDINMQIKWTNRHDNFIDAYMVRREVFVVEQKVPEELEIDEYDNIALHLVVYDDRTPVATGRIFETGSSFVIGRICVLREYRNMGLGNLLMEELIGKAISMGATEIVLSSQTYATGFYEKFGFKEYGNIYLDAGIEHISMRKKIL